MPSLKSFYGVRVENMNSGVAFAGINRFVNLKYGLLAYNSNIDIGGSLFEDITKVAGGGGIGPIPNGKAIYATNSTLTANGNAIMNCHTGILATQSSLKARTATSRCSGRLRRGWTA